MASKKGAAQTPTLECCLCGDYGLPEELISCRSCHFRSQHRCCSDLYPKAESNSLCNWCLKEDREKHMKEAIENRSLSSTCSGSISNSKKSIVNTRNSDSNEVGLKLQRCTTFQLHVNKPIKKKRSPERLTVNRSKQVFRSKVRRYKLLDTGEHAELDQIKRE